jgi:hypothetical protein
MLNYNKNNSKQERHMNQDTATLRFRTKWLHHTMAVLKKSCHNYHLDTRQKIDELVAAKAELNAEKA